MAISDVASASLFCGHNNNNSNSNNTNNETGITYKDLKATHFRAN